MIKLPRLAVGTVQEYVDRRPMVWAVLHVLEQCGIHVQAFLSQAELPVWDAGSAATGQPYRHLDPWLMNEASTREFFAHGAQSSDLGLVEGSFGESSIDRPSNDHRNFSRSGGLHELCQWLRLPKIAIVDAAQLSGCQLPKNLFQFDGVLLDRVDDLNHACRLQTTIESLTGVPVLGALPEAPRLRQQLRTRCPSTTLVESLGRELAPSLRLDKLVEIAVQQPFPSYHHQLFSSGQELSGLHIAVAFDEAFNRYFPDTLDLLELRGAKISDFSPLCDESLPEEANLVILGAGRIERYASVLAANHCLKQSLFHYVGHGGRIYAEGGGLAYLGQQVVLENGRHHAMAGILPSLAIEHDCDRRLAPMNSEGAFGLENGSREDPGDREVSRFDRYSIAPPKERAEITLAKSTWLGEAGWRLRGYLDSRWIVGPLSQLTSLAVEKNRRADLIECGQVVGGRLCVNFAAQPDFLQRFFQPSVFSHLMPV